MYAILRIAFFCSLCLPLAATPAPGLVKQFPASGVLRFELRDRLDHPLYWWPRTLLNYPVRFEQARVKAGDLRLVNAGSREPAPFQLAPVKERDGFLEFAVISFFADLPAGEARAFELSASGGQALAQSQVREQRTPVREDLRRSFTDAAPGVIPAMDEPGAVANAVRTIPPHKIYEYAIAAVNGNGESKRSTPVDTDPTSWVNWDPKPGERFRRRYTYNTSNYLILGKEEEIQRYYPR